MCEHPGFRLAVGIFSVKGLPPSEPYQDASGVRRRGWVTPTLPPTNKLPQKKEPAASDSLCGIWGIGHIPPGEAEAKYYAAIDNLHMIA